MDKLNYLRGWEIPCRDYALKNKVKDIQIVNLTDHVLNYKDKGLNIYNKLTVEAPCASFVFSGYLKPGLH
jgi:hypothetical protein